MTTFAVSKAERKQRNWIKRWKGHFSHQERDAPILTVSGKGCLRL